MSSGRTRSSRRSGRWRARFNDWLPRGLAWVGAAGPIRPNRGRGPGRRRTRSVLPARDGRRHLGGRPTDRTPELGQGVGNGDGGAPHTPFLLLVVDGVPPLANPQQRCSEGVGAGVARGGDSDGKRQCMHLSDVPGLAVATALMPMSRCVLPPTRTHPPRSVTWLQADERASDDVSWSASSVARDAPSSMSGLTHILPGSVR